ncbi:alkaline phosphatase 4 [Cephus cinctus]|uniref:Alkaline phosphatase n=1 Tax=Cephus cinctus TaxID=211228 RepID=A0AAJ7CE04_CEPCN|nr:alkaline phosphatase 4 [Cephus cinctus]XP_015608486.1 alkaline phosphatase 4 [Cephus cinctus]
MAAGTWILDVIMMALCVVTGIHFSDALQRGSTDYEDMSFWMKSGQEHLQRVLSLRNNENQAKNVIIFVGDGMGLSTVTAGRIFKGQAKGTTGEEYKLAFEKFPSSGLSKTYNVDKQVPDSAGTATAMFSGVKCRYKVIGLDGHAVYNECDAKINEKSKLTTIVDWAQESEKDTGFVTTTRITHATPGALYAHTNNRDWECDTSIPEKYKNCAKDIARQLVEDAPGNNLKVIMGGGGQNMGLPIYQRNQSETCVRSDGVNLAEIWKNNNPDGKVVTNTRDLMTLDIANTSKIMGIFAPSHMPFHAVRDTSPEGTPTLANMTLQAIRLLRKNKNGFLLMVESGKIDIAHHYNYAKLALREVSELEEAVLVALQQVRLDETLIIVTADHSHSFTMNGYPARGNDILGYTTNLNEKNVPPYETLTYANGPGFFYHLNNDSSNVNDIWRPIEKIPNRDEDPYYRNFAGFYMKDETHGGEDVAVYAIGPYSHLFRGTFEQNYIAHVIAYAACLKNWPSHCDKAYHRYFYELSSPAAMTTPSCIIVLVFITLLGLTNR